jgi:hypothetical protein
MPETLLSNLDWQTRLEPVYGLYAALARGVDPDAWLGGKLLYAGELHEDGCRLVRAANIAGAASLSATADTATQRHAIRDGVADFLVTSLDEALRILKNEIRKRQAASVVVSLGPGKLVAEMRERGVLPDLLLPAAWDDGESGVEEFLTNGARPVEIMPLPERGGFSAWASAPPDFDAIAMAALPETDHLNRRWLRLSPRYLGSAARRVRSLACAPEIASRLAAFATAQETPKDPE